MSIGRLRDGLLECRHGADQQISERPCLGRALVDPVELESDSGSIHVVGNVVKPAGDGSDVPRVERQDQVRVQPDRNLVRQPVTLVLQVLVTTVIREGEQSPAGGTRTRPAGDALIATVKTRKAR